LLNNILSAFAPLELTTDTSSFPNGQRDPRCNPDQWCCNGANGAEKAVSWLCVGPSSITGAGGKDFAQAKTILDNCGVLRVILPKADRRGGKNLDVPSLLAYCDSNQQYIAGWGAFLIDCGICGRQEALSTSDSLASTALTALQNAVGDLAVGVGCVSTAVEGTRINELTVTCGRSLADRDAICSS
jgi:hypothetical protein